jgi:D-2-hydroxyacid dehydrogenase (NADP+)
MPCLLVTQSIAERYGDAIRSAAGPDTTLTVLPANGTVASKQALDGIDVAFLSTDLMGASNKTTPNERLRTFALAVSSSPALQWIHTCSAGADCEILQLSMQRGIRVTTSSGANAQAVAQAAIAGMLALGQGVPHWVLQQAARQWATLQANLAPQDIDGNHALVTGMGPVGQAIGRICKAMGLRTTGVRRNAQPEPNFIATLPLGARLNNVSRGAAASTGFPQRTVDAFVQNLGRYVRGEPLINLASPS